MGLITAQEAFERFKLWGKNSSHFTWFLSDLHYFETTAQWVFCYCDIGKMRLMILEPLIPHIKSYTDVSATEFLQNFSQFEDFSTGKRLGTLGIGEHYYHHLRAKNFLALKVGTEPFVQLSSFMPKGNSGKSLRSARNQAVRSGVIVEEWSGEDLLQDETKKAAALSVYKDWKHSTFMQIDGIMLKTDPFVHAPIRNYFVAKKDNEIFGLLIADPIEPQQSFYFEDLVFKRNAEKGSTEYLTLKAMETFQQRGAKEVSLGVVALKSIEWDKEAPPSSVSLIYFKIMQKVFKFFYNSDGIEIFRKRFRPYRWNNIYVAFQPTSENVWAQFVEWNYFILILLRALRPHMKITFTALQHQLLRPLAQYPLTLLWLATNAFFLLKNQISAFPLFFFNLAVGCIYLPSQEKKLGSTLLASLLAIVLFLHNKTSPPWPITHSLMMIFLLGAHYRQLNFHKELPTTLLLGGSAMLLTKIQWQQQHFMHLLMHYSWAFLLGQIVARTHHFLIQRSGKKVCKNPTPKEVNS